jgi:hypothetical protein
VEDRLTIRLPRELSLAVKYAVRRAQRRLSEVVRMALRVFLDVSPAREGELADRVGGLLGSLDSGIPDLAQKQRAYVLQSLKNTR